MSTQNVIVKNKTGLHARPAFMLIQAASKFKSDITVKKGDKTGTLKSLLSLLSLGITCNDEITLTANGEDEENALVSIVGLINSKFGEE